MAELERDELQFKIDRYGDMLFGIAYLRLTNRADAEDAVQDTFYQYLRYRKSGKGFADEEHEKAWLIRVMINVCRKCKRSAWFRHRDDRTPDGSANAIGQTPNGTGIAEMCMSAPEEQAVCRESRERLLEAVMALPVKYREVIHLFYYEDLTVKEIGRLLGRKEATVTSQLTRGRELLRKSLKEEYDFA